MKIKTFFFVILGIFVSELIFQWNQTAGFVIYAVLLGVVLVTMEKDITLDKSEMLLIFLMIVPIARISELFLPFSPLWKIFAFYAVIAFLAIYYGAKFWIKSGNVKFEDLSYPLVIAILSVFAMAGAEYFFGMKNSIVIPLVFFIAYAEEILFRGEIQSLTSEKYGPVYGVFFTSLLYGIFTISYGFPVYIFAFIASIILCVTYQYTKNIYLTFIINVVFHALFFTLYPVITLA
jgi:membrane protease YdiL (CAAX protease family)